MVRARNRKDPSLSSVGAVKTSKWPRTSRRQERIESVLARRQPSLTVVLEDVHDPHNASAVLRSCDAVGVLDVHLVYVNEEPPRKSFGRSTSASAAKWIRLHQHESIEACYAVLREQGFTIAATALEPDSKDFYSTDLTRPTALVFGNEMRGVSEAAIAGADMTVYIPMQGMVESLNISVSCAVTLYEAMRQRAAAGMYETPQLSESEMNAIRDEWLKK
ncbi:MAG TPA: TrmH family RNA methyltransferase [Thermomicrobiales bacterium]|nr:TrmH family RNA methyltransferase [Thermomicrobiales bacterium]